MIRRVAVAAGSAACVASHPSAREVERYPAINLAAPLPYNVIGIHVVNATGETTLLAMRDRIEESVAACLNSRGIRVAANNVKADEDEIRWKPRRELNDLAAVALGKSLVVRGVLIIDLLELRRAGPAATGLTDGLALDARFVDRNAAAVVWARKAGPMPVPSVSMTGRGVVWVGPASEDRSFDKGVCQMLETLTARPR